jgi:hypothetical protein
LFAGLLCGRVWSMFCRGSLFGLLVYPFLGFWVLFWFGWNCLFDYELVGILECTVFLAIYELLLTRRQMLGAQSPGVTLPDSAEGGVWFAPVLR